MTGYQEILSDPSYCGQIVTFTYPLIGKYGVNRDDVAKRNDLMVPWLYLPESQQELDRQLVLAIPAMLASVGRYAVRRPH